MLDGRSRVRIIRTRDIRFPDEIIFPIRSVLNLRRAVQHLKDRPEYSVGHLDKMTIEFGMTTDPLEEEDVPMIEEAPDEIELTERTTNSKPSPPARVFSPLVEGEGEYPDDSVSTPQDVPTTGDVVSASTEKEVVLTTEEPPIPKRFYIRRNVELKEFGYSDDCVGCIAAAADTTPLPHSESCRKRIAGELNKHEWGRTRLQAALKREEGWIADRVEESDKGKTPSSSSTSKPATKKTATPLKQKKDKMYFFIEVCTSDTSVLGEYCLSLGWDVTRITINDDFTTNKGYEKALSPQKSC